VQVGINDVHRRWGPWSAFTVQQVPVRCSHRQSHGSGELMVPVCCVAQGKGIIPAFEFDIDCCGGFGRHAAGTRKLRENHRAAKFVLLRLHK